MAFVTVFRYEGITATENTDYEILQGSIVIREGEFDGTTTVIINDDDLIEGCEEFVVSIINITGYVIDNTTMARVTVVIEDNDIGKSR